MKERNGAGSPSFSSLTRHFTRPRDNTALSFWLHPCKRTLELTSLPARTERHLNYSAVTRGNARRVSSLSSTCPQINFVYRAETGLLLWNCLTIQFAQTLHTHFHRLSFWIIICASIHPPGHAFVIILEIDLLEEHLILMTNLSIKLESILFREFWENSKLFN